LPELLRRVAVLTIVSAIGIAALTPLAVRSAMPVSTVPAHLLDAAEAPASALHRAATDGRELSAALTLLEAARPIGMETLGTQTAIRPSLPSVAPMQATLYLKPTPPPPAPEPVVVQPPARDGSTITGKATWYCCTSGYRGQAVVALPGALGGQYDPPPAGRTVTVCADRCVELPVVDYCGCLWGTAGQKVADLSPEAWAAVSNSGLSAGVITVTLHL
jgi:hypothetical protein